MSFSPKGIHMSLNSHSDLIYPSIGLLQFARMRVVHLGRQSLSVPTWSFACRCLSIFQSGAHANVWKRSSVSPYNCVVWPSLTRRMPQSSWQSSVKRASFASRPEMQSLQRASRMPTKINVLMLASFSSCRLALVLAATSRNAEAQACTLNDSPRLAGSSVKSVEETDEVGISLYNLASWTSLEKECFSYPV